MSTSTIDIAGIEERLKEARGKEGATTATTMNLVVYIDDRSQHERALRRAESFCAKYPARVMILDATRTNLADVNNCTREAVDGATISTERIELGVGGFSPDIIASTVNALRIGDVPDVLWWTSRSLNESGVFEQILPLMDVLIVDSSGLDAEENAICEVANFAGQSHEIFLRDLAYMRLSPWQDMIAQFFDDERFVADLESIESVAVAAGSSAEAFYLVGWLASRLQWKPCARFLLCDRSGREIHVKFERKGGMRRVLRVALATSSRTFAAELSESADTVCLSVSDDGSARKRCVPLHHIDNLSLLEKAFLFNSRDDVFDASLHTLCRLLKL